MNQPHKIEFLGHTLDANRVVCVDPVKFHSVAGSIHRCGFLVRMEGAQVTIITESDYSRRGHAGGPTSEEIEKEADDQRKKFVKLVWPDQSLVKINTKP